MSKYVLASILFVSLHQVSFGMMWRKTPVTIQPSVKVVRLSRRVASYSPLFFITGLIAAVGYNQKVRAVEEAALLKKKAHDEFYRQPESRR